MDGAEGKQQPQLFRADLFSSPPSGLSLGLGDEAFSSPLSLAPALGTAATGSPSSKCALIGPVPIASGIIYALGILWVKVLHVSNSEIVLNSWVKWNSNSKPYSHISCYPLHLYM